MHTKHVPECSQPESQSVLPIYVGCRIDQILAPKQKTDHFSNHENGGANLWDSAALIQLVLAN